MDFLTCAFILPIVMNNLSYSKSSKYCGNSTDLEKQTVTPFVPSVSISTQLKDCSVVLQDISFSCGAAKLQMLGLSQDKTHMMIQITQLKVIFLRTCTWKHLLHGGTQLMNDGHN